MDKYLNLTAGRLIMMQWKAEEVKSNIKNNLLSYSKNMPLLVSYFPDERKYIIMDGHHRAMELFAEGNKQFCCLIAEHQPKIYTIDYSFITLKQFMNNIKAARS